MELSFFPQHDGYPAWPYYGEKIEDVAVEDLFWRKMQAEPSFTKSVIKGVWPSARETQHQFLIDLNFSVSLLPESCGAYSGQQGCDLPYLHGNTRDANSIYRGTHNPDAGGYYLGPLVAMSKGWLNKNVVRNLIQQLDLNITASDRYFFNAKANHHQVFVGELNDDEFKAVVENSFPAKLSARSCREYWYRTENGNINFGIIYYYDADDNFVYKLPISAWKRDFPDWRQSIVYDMLSIAKPYPLYCLNRLVAYSAYYVLVCTSEDMVEYIYKYHGWVLKYMHVTTYSSIEGTDWNKINGFIPIVFPDASQSGCYEAFRLHAALEKLGFKPRFIIRQKDAVVGSFEFGKDLMSGMVFSVVGCAFPEFAKHCLQEFGVQPPDGTLPKAIALASLPEPDVAPEPLLEGLLDTGEQMMIHAWRGVGKSLLAMLLGLCFASGKSALNGRVCPSRKYRVLLLDGEMSAHSLKMRGYRLCSGHDVPQESMDALMVRSVITEKKDLALETDEGLKACIPDLSWAEIIILDSVFKFFPTSMGAEFSGAGKLLELLHWCREHEKTLILIDHEGKNRGASFGTMGKEVALDVVLQLSKPEPIRVIKANVKKARNHEEPSGAYLEMRIDTREKGKRITFQVLNAPKGKPACDVESSGIDGEVEVSVHPVAHAPSLEEEIGRYVTEHPDTTQGKMTDALVEKGFGARSTIQARIKAMSEGGKLPSWQNRPKSHKGAEPPASAGSEN